MSNPGDMMLPLRNLEASNESDDEENRRPVGQFFNTLAAPRFSHANGEINERMARKFIK